jgi:plastocyanin
MRLGLVVALLLSACTLAACGSDSDETATGAQPAGTGTGAGGGAAIEISETEFALDPTTVRVQKTGMATFRVTNDGSVAHALEVDGQGIEQETATLQPGESAELNVDLSKEGSYELYCPIDGHRDQGMEGELIVGTGGAGTGTDDDGGDDDGGSMTSDDDDPYDY